MMELITKQYGRYSTGQGYSGGIRIITIPRSNLVDAYTMAGIIKDAGMTVEEFKEVL